MICRRHNTHLSVYALSPVPAFGHIRSPGIDTHDKVSLISQKTVPQISPGPGVLHGRRGRLAVYLKDHGIFLGRIKTPGLDHPPVQDSIPYINAEKFLGTKARCEYFLFECGVVFQHPDGLMSRQRDQLIGGRRNVVLAGMDGPPGIGRNLVTVMTRQCICGSDPFRTAPAVQSASVQVLFGGIIGRSQVIYITSPGIYAADGYHVKSAFGYQFFPAAVTRHLVQMPPAVFLTGPGK